MHSTIMIISEKNRTFSDQTIDFSDFCSKSEALVKLVGRLLLLVQLPWMESNSPKNKQGVTP